MFALPEAQPSYAVAEQEEVRRAEPASYTSYGEILQLHKLPYPRVQKAPKRTLPYTVRIVDASPSARWDAYLASLDGPAVGLSTVHAGAVRALWQELSERVGADLKLPVAGPGGELGFQLAWSYKHFYLSIDLAADGRVEWFAKDLQTGAVAGSGDDEQLYSPPEALIRLLTARCLRS